MVLGLGNGKNRKSWSLERCSTWTGESENLHRGLLPASSWRVLKGKNRKRTKTWKCEKMLAKRWCFEWKCSKLHSISLQLSRLTTRVGCPNSLISRNLSLPPPLPGRRPAVGRKPFKSGHAVQRKRCGSLNRSFSYREAALYRRPFFRPSGSVSWNLAGHWWEPSGAHRGCARPQQDSAFSKK